jgi:DNA repair photolyase
MNAGQQRRDTGLRSLQATGVDADTAWLRAAVESFEPRLREVEGRSAAPAAWEEPPGIGCGWSCRCCAGRPGRRLDLDRRARGAGDLSALLAGARRRRRTLVLGARTDPWGGPAARRTRTRRILEALREEEGLEVVVLTASPLLLCDRDLLAALDQAHSLTLELSLVTVDAALAHRLAPAGPAPAEVLGAVAELAAEGLSVQLRVRPLMPGTAAETGLARAASAAAAAGAVDLAASPLVLPFGAPRRRLFTWLAGEAPERLAAYRRLYRARTRLPAAVREALLAPLRRLRLEHGFPRPVPGRG